jgi:hypothetical protein
MHKSSDMRLSRRDILKTGGSTLVAMTIMPTGLIFGAGNAWAATAKSLKPETFATLVQACRDIYPHDHLTDSYYAKVVEGFDAAAAGSEDDKNLFENGVSALNKAAQSANGFNYIETGWEIQRVNILREMQDDAFFQKLRSTLVTGIYNNPDVWPMFGYEGESASKGGYINRGFDDIDWLDSV